MVRTKEQFQAITGFISDLERNDFSFGEWTEPKQNSDGYYTPAYYLLSSTAMRFVKECYEAGWVINTFSWSEYASTREAQQLRDNPSVLAQASEEQLARLLTIIIRQSRFVEGLLSDAYSSGLIMGILKRAQQLEAECV